MSFPRGIFEVEFSPVWLGAPQWTPFLPVDARLLEELTGSAVFVEVDGRLEPTDEMPKVTRGSARLEEEREREREIAAFMPQWSQVRDEPVPVAIDRGSRLASGFITLHGHGPPPDPGPDQSVFHATLFAKVLGQQIQAAVQAFGQSLDDVVDAVNSLQVMRDWVRPYHRIPGPDEPTRHERRRAEKAARMGIPVAELPERDDRVALRRRRGW